MLTFDEEIENLAVGQIASDRRIQVKYKIVFDGYRSSRSADFKSTECAIDDRGKEPFDLPQART